MCLRLSISAITLILLAFSITAGVMLARREPSDTIAAVAQPYGHSLLHWELEHVPGRWLHLIGDFFLGRDVGDEDAMLQRYFELGGKIERLQRLIPEGDNAAAERLSNAESDRRELENRVEKIIEGRVSDTLKQQGLTLSPPLFDGIDTVFPPVDMELGGSPRVLVISPRDSIKLERSYLLRNDMTLDEISSLEANAEADGVSALVDTTGGVATYPSTVTDDASYERAVELAAHEWIHQYLVFQPLGRRYFDNEEMRTINETVANISGREIAAVVYQRFPSAQAPAASQGPAQSGIDFNKEMRELRLAVDELLAQKEVEEAETLMEQKRLFLAENGYYIRKINQAFFAFHGTYADTPASSSPIGPKVQTVRERSASLSDFVQTMGKVSSVEELDALLDELRVDD